MIKFIKRNIHVTLNALSLWSSCISHLRRIVAVVTRCHRWPVQSSNHTTSVSNWWAVISLFATYTYHIVIQPDTGIWCYCCWCRLTELKYSVPSTTSRQTSHHATTVTVISHQIHAGFASLLHLLTKATSRLVSLHSVQHNDNHTVTCSSRVRTWYMSANTSRLIVILSTSKVF